jgi:hypothetical protein
MPGNNGNETLTVYDVTGKQVISPIIMKSSLQNKADVSSLLPGIYIYSITGSSGFTTQGKFIVTR